MLDGACWAGRELLRRPGRSGSVVAGYALAAGMAVALLTLFAGLREDAARVLSGTGTHFVAFAPYSAAGPACSDCAPAPGSLEGFVAGTVWTGLLPPAALEQAKALPQVLDASPYVLYRLEVLTIGGFDTTAPVAVRTTTCAPADVLQGRFLEPGERGAVLVEEGASRQRALAAGDTLGVSGREYRVVGIVNTGIRPVKADVYMSLEDATELVEGRIGRRLASRFNVLLVEARSAEVHERAMAEVRALLGQSAVLSTYACYRPAAQVLGINARGMLLLVGLASLLVLALAWQSRHASIVERRRDLGILRAVGWSDREILGQLLLESLMLALLGWAAGCLLATAALLAGSLPLPAGVLPALRFRPSWQPYLATLAASTAGGAVAGLGPAARALRLSAAEMLRAL